MPEKMLKIVSIFIGSPGGLDNERKAAKRIVDEINESHADNWGCQIRLVGWEATLPGNSRAQSLINQDLDKCDYFVGVLWDRWGSQTDDGDSKFSSGFEEEFERAKTRTEAGLMKDIALYFKEIEERQLTDPGPSLKKVIAFRENCKKKRRPFYRDFKEGEFEGLLRAKISAIGWDQSRSLNAETAAISDPAQPVSKPVERTETHEGPAGLWGASSLSFVNSLLNKPDDWEAIDPTEVARFRLVALGVSRTGNDDMYLGNHDANLLFAKRDAIDFSHREIQSLRDAGIVGYHHQNIPLWNWLARGKAQEFFDRPNILAALGNDQERTNAIRILQAAGLPTPSIDEFITRERTLTLWLSDERNDKDFESACDFLRTNGSSEDLVYIEKRLETLTLVRQGLLAITIVLIHAKADKAKAFETLVKLNPDPMSEREVAILFNKPESIPTTIAEQCIGLKSENVRRAAAKLLFARMAIDTMIAQKFVADTDMEIRLIGAESLRRTGTPLSDEILKKMLTKERLGGLLAFRSSGPDDTLYQKYKLNELTELRYEELKVRVTGCDLFDRLELAALYSKHTRKSLAEIRANLADTFKGHFDTRLARLEPLYRDDPTRLASIKNLESFVRKNLKCDALDALCKYGSSADLKLVRKVLDDGEVDFSAVVLGYLGRHGDWSDRNRIIGFSDRYGGSLTMLFIPSDERASAIAAALYCVGKDRIADLLDLVLEASVRRKLIGEFSRRNISEMSDATLMKLLNSNDYQLRRIVGLKCAQALMQGRIRKLLDRYVSQDGQRYYNSIHWLDLGASMPRGVVKAVSDFELARTI